MTYVRYNAENAITEVASWPAPGMVQVDFEVVTGYDGRFYKAGEEPRKPAEMMLAEMQAAFTDAVQERLDTFARTRGYDGIMSACSYFGSANPRFKAEADRAITLRDATWARCYAILAEVQSGKREVPTQEALLAELPALTWE